MAKKLKKPTTVFAVLRQSPDVSYYMVEILGVFSSRGAAEGDKKSQDRDGVRVTPYFLMDTFP